MYGQFGREMLEATDEKESWNWLRKADVKVEREAMLCAAQEQAIRTNYVKHKIDKTAQSKNGLNMLQVLLEMKK